ncbi:septum site-determining protein minC [Deinococcus maricopensis DSM 21211]|uniref:Probable septum site-determining protein MinC n=2 Tax=Deinococcus TaxID=1298 RepID=E8U9F7_DEIML|nr:septum site-determining protein minC [Deinococcus maricopensis DSM 21211]
MEGKLHFMKLRGTLGGLNLLLEPQDTGVGVTDALGSRTELLNARVTLEVAEETSVDALESALGAVRGAGGSVSRVRAPRVNVAAPVTPEDARTVIVPHGLRAGTLGQYPGSVVILGDVNPGAEIVAGGDVIVVGALRGKVHAGAGGNAGAIVWARPIASPQIRVADALARSPEDSALEGMRKLEGGQAEVARLQDGAIVIEVQPGR